MYQFNNDVHHNDGDGCPDTDDSSTVDENESISSYSESVMDNESIESNSDSEEEDIIIEFDDFSDDEEDEIALDLIYNDDKEHLDSEKTHSQYYIGFCKFMRKPNLLLMLTTVSPKAFYKYQYCHVLKYLYYYSSVRLLNPTLDIMQLKILDDGTYSVILKTYWIRLIQRHWRIIIGQRTEVIKGRKKVASICWRQTTGRWPHGLNILPGIKGMLRQYQ
uniref:Uncharacterized protein n=1 Tax=viral metagenome TaxID=1070528 RepID=A0A6C0JJ55_9ZZZZ